MSAARGWYSLIQYCPDRSRAEAANVGVVLFCPDRGFIRARTSDGNDRIRRFFRGGTFDPSQINEAKRAIEERLEVERDRFRTVTDLEEFIHTRAHDLVLTSPRAMRVEDPDQDMERLFEELVGGRARRRPRLPQAQRLDDLFRRHEGSSRVWIEPRYQLPVVDLEIRVPYAFQNGRLNLVKPVAFSPLEERFKREALSLAPKGELIDRYPPVQGMPATLVVVSMAQEDAADMETWIERLLREFRVEFIRSSRIAAFTREVEEAVQSH
jgi:hypothetical protein